MKRFFKTVAIVTVFSVCEKFLGFLYRIYLSRSIGAEGVGLYQVALSVFAFLLTATCSGTPITVSRLMTKYRSEGSRERVYRVISSGFAITLAVALPVCIVFYFSCGKLSFLFADERCIPVFKVVIFGLSFTSLYSVLRGVFWGSKDFLPYSVIELLEEICMIIAGIILIGRTSNAADGAYAAGLAVLVSYVFSFTLAAITFFARKNRLADPRSELKPLISSAAPVTAMRTVNALGASVVSVVFPLRLVAAGFPEARAMSLYGAAVGQALPLLFVPTTLIGSFTLVLVPEISESFYKKQNIYLKNDVEKAVKFTALLSSLFIPAFFVCGEEIGTLVFGNADCGRYLTASAFLMFFASVSSLTNSILNSIGKEGLVLSFTAGSGVLMVLSVWFLPKLLGVYALLVGFSFVYVLTTVLNLALLYKTCPEKPKYCRYLFLCVALVLPACAFGLLLEKILLPFCGTFCTFLICSAASTLFLVVLDICFGLIFVSSLKIRFCTKPRRKPCASKERGIKGYEFFP